MSKFKPGAFVKGIEAQKLQEQEQLRKRNKYKIESDDVVIVEKNNIIKFLVLLLIRIIKMAATISVIVLAIIGVLALLYPASREILLQYFYKVLLEIQMFVGIR